MRGGAWLRRLGRAGVNTSGSSAEYWPGSRVWAPSRMINECGVRMKFASVRIAKAKSHLAGAHADGVFGSPVMVLAEAEHGFGQFASRVFLL